MKLAILAGDVGAIDLLRSWLGPSKGIRGRFAHGAFWSLLGAVVATVSNQLATVFFSRLLGSEGLGALAMIQNIVVFGGVVSGSGAGIAVTKHLAAARGSSEADQKAIARAATLAAWMTSGVVSFTFFALAEHIGNVFFGSRGYLEALRAGAPLMLLSAVFVIKQGVMAGFEDYQGIAQSNAWRGLTLIFFAAALVPQLGLTGAILALTLSTAAGVGLCGLRIHRRPGRASDADPDRSEMKRAVAALGRSALPVLVSGMAVAAGNLMASAHLASTNQGLAALGEYYAAERWRLLCVFVATYGGAAALPILTSAQSSGDSAGFREMIRVSILASIGSTLPLSLGAAALSKPLMAVYGSTYSAAWPVMLLMALSALPMALNSALGQILISRGAFWERAFFDVLLAMSFICLAFVMVADHGAFGLAVASLVAYLLISAALLWRCLKHAH